MEEGKYLWFKSTVTDNRIFWWQRERSDNQGSTCTSWIDKTIKNATIYSVVQLMSEEK